MMSAISKNVTIAVTSLFIFQIIQYRLSDRAAQNQAGFNLVHRRHLVRLAHVGDGSDVLC